MRVKVRKKPAPAVVSGERENTALKSHIAEYGIPSAMIVDKPIEEISLDMSYISDNTQILADICRKVSSLKVMGSL